MIPILSDRLCWSSAIGNFILNFGILDLLMLDHLEATLPKEFPGLQNRNFQDRVGRLKKQVSQADLSATKKVEFAQFFLRLERRRVRRDLVEYCDLDTLGMV